jgi:hypothetical protein
VRKVHTVTMSRTKCVRINELWYNCTSIAINVELSGFLLEYRNLRRIEWDRPVDKNKADIKGLRAKCCLLQCNALRSKMNDEQ